MAYLAGTTLQFSDTIKLDRTRQERWISEPNFKEYALLDSLGNRSRVLRATISNPFNARKEWYPPMIRVRLLEDFGVVAFLGRVVSVEPNYSEQTMVITCRDFLDDLADRTVEAAETDGVVTAVTRMFMVDQILKNDTYTPTIGGDLERNIIRRLQMDPSAYSEQLTRTYGQRGKYQTVTGTGTTALGDNYQYRGVKTGMEAISELATEDPQQDIMAFYYHYNPTNPDTANSNWLTNPQAYPRTYWTDLTQDIVDGNTHFVTPQFSQDTATPQNVDILYFGSNSKFDGIKYTFVTRGTSIDKGTYAGNLQWQYWNGRLWTSFTPTADAKFGVDAGKIYGTTNWTLNNLTDWGRRDLGSTPDMHTEDDDDLVWDAPWSTAGDTDTTPEVVNSKAISKIDHGDERRNTNRYWVRVYVRTGSITVGKINTVELYTKPNLFHDFRAEDPQYFSEVWSYIHNTATTGWGVGRDGPGGGWADMNMTGPNDGSGRRLLWNSNDFVTPFIGTTADTWYFGSEHPFNGIQFHSYQGKTPDYGNVDLVWQWFSHFSGDWQTISGLTITGNTVANPTVITTERHNMVTGTTITISGSNSTPSINGTHTITWVSATTFSIPVNVTTAGTAGHVVVNHRISDSATLAGGTGAEAWKLDIGSPDDINDYYIDVKWDTDLVTGYFGTSNTSVTRNISQPEFDRQHLLTDYPYKDMAHLNGPNIGKASVSVDVNSISAANPTVITSAASNNTTTNHNLRTGDLIRVRGSNSTPSIDGIHAITKINATTFSIPVNVTNAGTAATDIYAYTNCPSSRSLYWVRCYIKSGTPTTVATLKDVKTASTATLKYFDRGKEPWETNRNTTPFGTVAKDLIKYCYRYDSSASANSRFTDYSAEIQSSTSDTSLRITGNTLANPTVITTAGPSLTISSNTVADATVVTTSAVHGMATGDKVVITNSNSTPDINDTWEVTVLSTTTFSLPITVTSAGSQGTAVPVLLHGLSTGHKVVITGSNSTPTINGTHAVTVISTTTFSIAVNVTTAGTAGTVVPEKVYAMDNGQVNDAIYFGMDEPFSMLRLNISDVLSSSSAGYSAVTWEYFEGEGTDSWATLSHRDFTSDLSTGGYQELLFTRPYNWKTCQPGTMEASGNATDIQFGKTAYYVRARITGNTGSPATSAAKFIQGWVGPTYWHPGKEVGTLSGITSTRHATPRYYGLTLSEVENSAEQVISIASHSLSEKPIDFVNKVSVRGHGGAYGVAEDTTSIDTYGIVKERVVDDSTLANSLQCEKRAQAILEQFRPDARESFRECKIRLLQVPVYSVLHRPRMLRAGDSVNVVINTGAIDNETWLVYSINCNYSEDHGWGCDLVLFRNLRQVFEPGAADRRIIRDLVTRSRETANAVFQPLDKAVVDGLDFLPVGPGGFVGRDEFGIVGTELDLVPQNGGTTKANFYNEYRWTKKIYSNHSTRETLSKDLMRIDLQGLNPEEDGSASGGAGLGLIGRDRKNGTQDFHPGPSEGTLYLRDSGTLSEGRGLYLAHRDIFNNGDTYDEFITDTPKLNAEVMTGFTGFIDHNTLDADGLFTINLPNLDSIPLIFTSICGHEGLSGTPGNNVNATCNVRRWTSTAQSFTVLSVSATSPTTIYTSVVHNFQVGDTVTISGTSSTPAVTGTQTVTAINNNGFSINVNVSTGGSGGTVTGTGKYTAASMQVAVYPNSLSTATAALLTVSAISQANPTVITVNGSIPNGTGVWISGSNSTPKVDGLYTTTARNDNGNGTWNSTLVSADTSVFPVNVTSAGTAGSLMRMTHHHVYNQAAFYDYSDNNPAIGVMYAVVFNSGKNTSGLNSHYSQNHTDHG